MPIQISGLGSDLDTNSIIKQLMEIERRPVRLLERRQQTYQAKQDAWRDVNTKLLTLQNKSSALKGFEIWKVMDTASADESVVTATAGVNAASGTYEIRTKQLASAVSYLSNANMSILPGNKIDPDAIITGENVKLTTPIVGNGGDAGSFTIQVGAGAVKQVDFDISVDTLNDIMERISSETDANAFYDSSLDKVTITSKTTGDVNIAFADLGVATFFQGIQYGAPVKSDGKDAKFTINSTNLAAEITSSSNAYTTAGITFNLKSINQTAPYGDPGTSVTVSRDTDTIRSAIGDFVTAYNDAMSFVREKLTYKKDNNTGGELSGDAALQAIYNQLTNNVIQTYPTGNSDMEMLVQMGISIGRYGSSDQGKLVIDETKLTSALTDSIDKVKLVWTINSPPTDGAAYQMEEDIKPYTRFDGMIDNSEEMYKNMMDDIDEQIVNFERLLDIREQRLRRQFAAMESLLASLKDQSNWLSSQVENL